MEQRLMKQFAPTLRPFLVPTVAIALACAAGPSAAAVVFDFSQVNASTDASLAFGANTSNDSNSAQANTVPAAGVHASASSVVSSSASAGADVASAAAAVSATFAPDSASGHFLFGPNTTHISAVLPESLSADADSSGNAVYDFTLTGPAVFTLNYTIDSSGIASGGNQPDLSFLLLDFTTFTPVIHTGALTTSGSFTSGVLAAGDYQFFVQNFDQQSSQLNDPGATSTSLNANFGFSIGSVPEPATWAMMLAGFGVMCTALRRRRAQAAADLASALPSQ
jgi:hypothetical protein